MAHAERVEALVRAFRADFGVEPEGIAEAPGRVNLIGEHVDYNNGLVLPFAIDRSVMCASARREDVQLRAHALDAGEAAELWLRSEGEPGGARWTTYVLGVARTLTERGVERGLDIAISGDVPIGAGLSSSAAIEVAVAGALRDALALDIDDVELAKLCQRAENEYAGVRSGIMDQFTSTLARQDHALLIDCRTLAYRQVPLRLAEHGLAIIVANSAAPRELASSAYNERRRECEHAVTLLKERLGRDVASLRDVTADEVAGAGLPQRLDRRARHVAGEIARVERAATALESRDFDELGRLMAASHRSLREDYEVSSEQLDLLVDLAAAREYVLGARLTGAGFGGCTVNLVRAEAVEAFARDVMAVYRERTGLPGVIYVVEPCDGLRTWRVAASG